MTYNIKHYDLLTKDELYQIMKLRNEVFVVEQTCVYQDIDGKDLDAYHLCCYEGDELIGYLRILNPGLSYKEMSIGRVLVKDTYRDKKIGKLIMEESINYIKEVLNQTVVRISAQAYLQKFYTSLGFDTVSEEYLEDDIPHIEMLLNM
ncbi:MAG: GNAT family N-acetyltransferase [Clostridiales bacterium]|nr:GNAT family N-acetyltransferase [Clostridiales bacterium]